MGEKLQRMAPGSALAAELRRLRGGRSLQEIAELTRAPSLAGQVLPLSALAIARLESGAGAPTVEALHSLAVVYRVSAQRFLDLMASERLQSGVHLPDTADETHVAYNAALREARWHDAIALALHGEGQAVTETDRVVWRARRGSAMPYVGRHDDAILLLTECLNSPHLGRQRRFQILRNLADVHVIAGYLESAVDCARKALSLVPSDASDATKVAVVAGLVSALLTQQERSDGCDAGAIDEALRLIGRTRRMKAADDPHWALFFDSCRGVALRLQGREGPAARAFRTVARRAGAAHEHRMRLVALLNLGTLRRRQRRVAIAERHLLHALSIALNLKQVNETFEIYVELLLLAREAKSPLQSTYFQRCQHYYPLVSRRTPSVQCFEALERGASA